jgi:hypothetical protein
MDLARAVTAEDGYRRMCALQRMSAAELRDVLCGEAGVAAPWVEAAARLGVAEGQIRFGQMLLDGAVMSQDPAAALRWFLKAAIVGAPAGMNMAGRCYENGWGAEVDLEEAARWYLLAAEAGHDWGAYNWANMRFDGRGVAQSHEDAVAWYRRAADQGHARAMNLLARCCEEGWGTARDPAEAVGWYRGSAEAGYFRAQFNYGAVLAGVGRVDEALDWFEQACRDATPDSRAGMIARLAGHPEPRIAALGRRLASSLPIAVASR